MASNLTLPPVDPTHQNILTYMVIAGAAFYCINLLCYCYCLYNRNYPPLKAKNISLMGIVLFSSILFWLGISHSFGLFGWNGVWAYCDFLRVWAEYPFGVQLFVFILSYRLLILYRLLIQKKTVTIWWKLIVIAAFYIPLLTCYIVFDVTGHTAYTDPVFGCVSTMEWSIFSFAVIFAELIILLFLTVRLRNIKQSFHEYKETRYGFVFTILCYTVVTVIYFNQWNYTFAGRAIILSLLFVVLNFYFWVVLFRPFYDCMFHYEEALERFNTKMGLETEWVNTFIRTARETREVREEEIQ